MSGEELASGIVEENIQLQETQRTNRKGKKTSNTAPREAQIAQLKLDIANMADSMEETRQNMRNLEEEAPQKLQQDVNVIINEVVGALTAQLNVQTQRGETLEALIQA